MSETCRGHLWDKIIIKLFASSWYIFLYLFTWCTVTLMSNTNVFGYIQLSIYLLLCCTAVRRKTVSSHHLFLSAARRNPAAASWKRLRWKTNRMATKGWLLLVWTQGGCCRGWREWELIKRLATPRGGTFVWRWFYKMSVVKGLCLVSWLAELQGCW